MVRQPIVASQFYPESRSACERQLAACLSAVKADAVLEARALCGAIVPHAGWACSGKVTASVLTLLSRVTSARTVVLLGAVHRVTGTHAAVYDSGAWETPLGQVQIDEELAQALLRASPLMTADPQAHCTEHSVEVQVPFIQALFPGAAILPIMVPPSPAAAEIGTVIGRTCHQAQPDVVFVGTTDLTHYGPSYGMTDHGMGAAGLQWAKNDNDRRMIACIESMDAASVIPEAGKHRNACGPGAVAATMAACREFGATEAILVEHTTSAETLSSVMPGPFRDAVGYGGFVFAKPSSHPLA